MAKHSEISRTQLPVVRSSTSRRKAVHRPAQVRRLWKRLPLTVLAFVVSLGFVMVNAVDPSSGAVASPYYQAPARFNGDSAQRLVVASAVERTLHRDGFDAQAKPAPPPVSNPAPVQSATPKDTTASGSSSSESVPRAAAPNPGSAKAIAYDMIVQRGWADSEYNCLVLLWNRESGWNVSAHNASSGAYGIPQALPGSKMGSVASDWATNPATQITWGLGYISGRYGSPCGAWAHSNALGWY
ncbi:lytic transglycosylase domain-containing protein [Rathayibacter toxicus]|uniref:aggregation-promoting factor C-terminal-like domain-containing protein n=1 Tax=Rathayibacter toxicus TaxID=145458 RepID=UPI001E4DBD72|nr:lytic transglycosylase domain-containing protein [Rathayibacter toxicus]